MALKKYSQEEIEDLSMIELAKKILTDTNKAVDFREIYDQISTLKGYSEKEKEENLAQFYTDLNIDGSFLTLGSNLWGLKRWYPVDQIDEEITAAKKKKKKKKKAATKKKKKEEVVDESEEDLNLDEEELDFDVTDLDGFDDDDLEDDDFDFDEDEEDDDTNDDNDSSDDDKKDE